MSDKLFLWVEKYRPQKIDECILPEATKKIFEGFLGHQDPTLSRVAILPPNDHPILDTPLG